MIAALRAAEADAGEPVCYVISGDLAHIGPKFDDEDLVDEDMLLHSKAQDDVLMERAVAPRRGRVLRRHRGARRMRGESAGCRRRT